MILQLVRVLYIKITHSEIGVLKYIHKLFLGIQLEENIVGKGFHCLIHSNNN